MKVYIVNSKSIIKKIKHKYLENTNNAYKIKSQKSQSNRKQEKKLKKGQIAENTRVGNNIS